MLLFFSRIIITVRYLKFKQIFFQIFYRTKKFFPIRKYNEKELKFNRLLIKNDIKNFNSYSIKNDEFIFLNRSKKFEKKIDWNFIEYGLLWNYNLNYFDFLNQKSMNVNSFKKILKSYIENYNNLKYGKDSFPTSLRIINIIKFISKHNYYHIPLIKILRKDVERLCSNLEFHILANHLLKNLFALYISSYFFRDIKYQKILNKFFTNELNEQININGAHFELSPMYHNLILEKLIDCYKVGLLNSNAIHNKIHELIEKKVQLMLSWSKKIEMPDGNIPMINDSTFGISKSFKELYAYYKKSIVFENKFNKVLKYFPKIKVDEFEMLINLSQINPKYQPGHSHADNLNFILYYKKKPIIVDPGISTYEKCKLRDLQRSTEYHNTVVVNNKNSSDVWSAFRVGRRGNTTVLSKDSNMIKASQDGYRFINTHHLRSWKKLSKSIIINDTLKCKSKVNYYASIHFHPDCDIKFLSDNSYIIDGVIKIRYIGSKLKILKETYHYSLGFNKTTFAIKHKIFFKNSLKTSISKY